MSICDECNGTGKVRKCFYEKAENGLQKVWDDVPCEWCNGTGQIEQTNEEWFAGLSTERKAHFFAERFGGSAERYNSIYNTMLKWLKAVHKE